MKIDVRTDVSVALRQVIQSHLTGKGLTQQDFAFQAGVSSSVVSRLLSGETRFVNSATLPKLARALSMDAEDLKRLKTCTTVPSADFCATLAVNVDNERLPDAAFREFVRNTLPIVIYSQAGEKLVGEQI